MRGLDNAITTIILTGVAVALAVGLSIWVFETAAAASKVTAIKVEPMGISQEGGEVNLYLMVINDYAAVADMVGLDLGSMRCNLAQAIQVPSDPNGTSLRITVYGNGTLMAFLGAGQEYKGTCVGSTSLPNGTVSGAIISLQGQEYPFSVSR